MNRGPGKRKRILPLFDSVRNCYERAADRLPIPNVSPKLLSGASLFLSIVFMVLSFRGFLSPAIAVLGIVFILDALDGIVARKYSKESEEGATIDFFTDRLSEGLVTLPFFFPWFIIFGINNLVSIIGLAKKRHTVFPVRLFLLIWLVRNEFFP